MSSDKEQRNEGIVLAGNRGLTKYSSDLIQRGLDFAKELDLSKAAIEVSRQTTEITKPQTLIWRCVHTLRDSSGVSSVAISPDEQTLVTGGDKTIKIWNLNTGELLSTFTGHSGWVWSVTFSPDGQSLASGSKDKTIKLWNLHTGELLHTLTGHSDGVWSVAASANGQTLASSSRDGSIKVWQISPC